MNKSAKDVILIAAFIVPMLAYAFNMIIKRNTKKFIETKTINTGRYKDSPLYGTDAIEMAHSFERVGLMILVFSILFSILCFAMLYFNDWFSPVRTMKQQMKESLEVGIS